MQIDWLARLRDTLSPELPDAETVKTAKRGEQSAPPPRGEDSFGNFGTFDIGKADEADERKAIMGEPALPPPGGVERAAMDRQQAVVVAGLIEAARWPRAKVDD